MDTALDGLGAFTETPGGFKIQRYHLEEPWSYLYANGNLLAKVDQRGLDFVQFQPPAGTVLLKRERFQRHSSFLVWIKTDHGRAFTNFFGPVLAGDQVDVEPDDFVCDYAPERAWYRVQWQGIRSETEIVVPVEDPVLIVACTVSNAGDTPRRIVLFPVLRPHLAAASLAPWDAPALYQEITCHNLGKEQRFRLELRNPAGLPEKREYASVTTDVADPEWIELSYDAFVGRGSFASPEALDDGFRAGGSSADDSTARMPLSINGRQGVVALKKTVLLQPGQDFRFQVMMGRVAADVAASSRVGRPLAAADRETLVAAKRREVAEWFARRRIATADPAFDRYVNEFLPLQLQWVNLLDRGWPTGLRGVRDAAQDATALIPLDRAAVRRRLLELFRVQRSDGWFSRQYSIAGPRGTHDLRNYVDGGVWVWELLYDYLCHAKDWDLLREEAGYLDGRASASILDHAVRLIGYYVNTENRGAHGLCLIREGDWNDSVNRAGLEGRGESVMVSCQVVGMLRQAAALFRFLAGRGGSGPEYGTFPAECVRHAADMQECLLRHAYNRDGYFNGVFTDAGEWVFSTRDPDGRRRINLPVNAFALIAGIVQGDQADRLLGILAGMKQRDGWPLFHPGIGDPPISHLGRIGAGDLAVGLGENGTPYNHGSHGFLGRAAAALGAGDLLLEIFRFMFPYDQQAHPVARSKTAPYGVVNHWKTAPGQEGRGGDLFLSGSISTALRNVYGGLFGIRPALDGLIIAPSWPSRWREAHVQTAYGGAAFDIRFEQGDSSTDGPRLFLDGVEIRTRLADPVLGRDLPGIPDGQFKPGDRHTIRCRL
ncbi:MAG: hypothetical protein PHR35_10215 [Kiritimatiellae bacterium]|nr:hypothetical protein [Kiritimatiellia bacterium]